GIRAFHVTGVQTCALPIWAPAGRSAEAEHLDRLALVDLPVRAEAQAPVEVLRRRRSGVVGDVELRAAPAADLLGHRPHGEPAVAPALLVRRDVQPPQAGAADAAVPEPVGVEEGHEEADRAP